MINEYTLKDAIEEVEWYIRYSTSQEDVEYYENELKKLRILVQ